jgi:hypothetical protein
MSLDDAQAAWRSTPAPSSEEFTGLVAKVRSAERFEARIRGRDLVESAAALIVIAAFLPALFSFPGWLSRIGAGIIIVHAIAIMVVLHGTRRRRGGAPVAAPLKEFFLAELTRVDDQIYLLKNVGWWYIAPSMGGACLVLLGLIGWNWPALGLCGTFIGFGVYVCWLNQRAVRSHLLPLRESLVAAERELEAAD